MNQSQPRSSRPGHARVQPHGIGPSTAPVLEEVLPAKSRGNNHLWLFALLAGVALLGGIVAVALGNRSPRVETPIGVDPGETGGIDPLIGLPLNGAGGLTAATDATVVVDIYSDFSCPYCANFEANYSDQILAIAGQPNVSLRFHPVSVLDRSGNGSGFSTLAGAILLETAVTAPEHVWAMNDFLLHNQQQLASLPGNQLVAAVTANGPAGVSLPPIETVLSNRLELLNSFTSAFHNTGGTGVPFILINGQQWTPGELPWPNVSLVDAVQAASGR